MVLNLGNHFRLADLSTFIVAMKDQYNAQVISWNDYTDSIRILRSSLLEEVILEVSRPGLGSIQVVASLLRSD